MVFLLPIFKRAISSWLLIFVGLLFLFLVSCQQEKPDSAFEVKLPLQPPGPDFFQEMTDKTPSLKNFLCRNGEDKNHSSILESLGGGVGAIDFDGDGLLDLVLVGGGDFIGADKKQLIGYPTRLFKNLGNFVFQEVTEEVLPEKEQALFYSHGVAVCDFDRDGWPDLLVTGYGRVALYRNVSAGMDEKTGKEKRKFVEVTKEAGLLMPGHFWATSAAFGDLDGDGWPDLYICQYVDWSWDNHPYCKAFYTEDKRDICAPKSFNAKQHALYQNVGGKFVEVTAKAGLRIESDDPDKEKQVKRSYCGKGLGVLIADLDGDGRPDLFVANDTTDSFLYLNESQPGQIKLQEVSSKWGVATDMDGRANGSMGVDAGDIDGSGQPALCVTNFENELYSLFRITGTKSKGFYHASFASGLGAIGKSYVGWGIGLVDLDNDGWLDLVAVNGHAYRYPTNNIAAQKPVLFLNSGEGKGKFVVATERGGKYFQSPHKGRGLAIADLNNDGYSDLVINNLNEPPVVLKNICPAKNHWLGVTLVAKDHADMVGAKAVLRLGQRTLTHFQKGGGSYLSARDGRLLFGLGAETKVGSLIVHWPSGEPRLEHIDGLAIDAYNEIRQGKGKQG